MVIWTGYRDIVGYIYIYVCNQLKMIWVCLKMAYTPSHVDREHDAINNGNWGYAAFSDKPLWMVHYWIRSPGKSSHFTSLRTITNETLVFTSKTPAKMWILSLPLIYSPTWFSNGLISVPSQLKPPDQPLLNEYRKKNWLVVDLPLWKITISQLGLLHSQLNGKWKMFQTTNQCIYYIYISQHPVMLRSSPILIIWIIDQHSIKSPFENLLVVQSPIISCQSMFIPSGNLT